jgi:hypothetical protein
MSQTVSTRSGLWIGQNGHSVHSLQSSQAPMKNCKDQKLSGKSNEKRKQTAKSNSIISFNWNTSQNLQILTYIYTTGLIKSSVMKQHADIILLKWLIEFHIFM